MPLSSLLASDLEMILTWRNAPEVRKSMYSSHLITMDEHRAWFESIRDRIDCQWFVYKEKDGKPSGVVYFNNISKKNRSAFWGFYGGVDAVKGVGSRMLSEALGYAFDNLMLHKINSDILIMNKKSIYLHKKLGFLKEGIFRDFLFNGREYVDVVRMGLLEDDWRRRHVEISGEYR